MTTIIQGINIQGFNVYDSSFNSNGALLYLDSGQAASYSGSGTAWTDLSGNSNNATLVNSPAYTTAWNGDFAFNGTGSQYASTIAAKFNQTYTGKTVFVAARMTAVAATTFRCLFGTNGGTRNFNTYIYSLVRACIKYITVAAAAADSATTYHLLLINGSLLRSRKPQVD